MKQRRTAEGIFCELWRDSCQEGGMCMPKKTEYMIFVDKIREKLKIGQSIDEAIDQAINECIEENVLKDFLVERGNEVRQVAALDYTWEARDGMIRKEEYEEGYKAGEIETILNLSGKICADSRCFGKRNLIGV